MRVLADINAEGSRVLLRADFNVPLRAGIIHSTVRIEAVLPTIRTLLASGARLTLLSHLGRPKAGQYDANYSLAPIAEYLSTSLKQEVLLVRDWHLEHTTLTQHPLQLLENVRFCEGELDCATKLSKRIASLGDVFVMDAFATAHRAHASTVGAIRYAHDAVAGPLLMAEVQALDRVMSKTGANTVAVIGGAKVSGKLELLESLAQKTDCLLLGGGILNTFLYASGFPIGKSLFEPELADTARAIMSQCNVLLPRDVVVRDIGASSGTRVVPCEQLSNTDIIGDIGPEGIKSYCERLRSAESVIWNGPLGIFEDVEFTKGTYEIAHSVANCRGFTVAGGGDTVAAIEQSGIDQSAISCISTAGGAFLEYLCFGTLPVIEALKKYT